MPPSDSRDEHRFTPDAVTPETVSQPVRRDPVLPATAADAMPELSVAIVANDAERCTELRRQVDATGLARTVLTCASFPVSTSDPVTKSLKTTKPDVLLIDIPSDNFAAGLRAVELLHQEMPESRVFAIGSLNSLNLPRVIDVMRAGARDSSNVAGLQLTFATPSFPSPAHSTCQAPALASTRSAAAHSRPYTRADTKPDTSSNTRATTD